MITRPILAVATALALAGCAGDATSPGARLSPSESRGLAVGLATASSGYARSSRAATFGVSSASVLVPISLTFKAEVPCFAGGTVAPDVRLTGSYDAQARSATLDLTGNETLKDCGHLVDGEKITVSGTLALAGHAAVSAGHPEGTQTFGVKGSFDWAKADGTSGTCALDLTAAADFDGNLGTVTGTLCGTSVDLSRPLR